MAVIEVKIVPKTDKPENKTGEKLKDSSHKAIQQIKDTGYAQPYINLDYHVVACGVSFSGKDCVVTMEKLS